jgi:hypothetical protein
MEQRRDTVEGPLSEGYEDRSDEAVSAALFA